MQQWYVKSQCPAKIVWKPVYFFFSLHKHWSFFCLPGRLRIHIFYFYFFFFLIMWWITAFQNPEFFLFINFFLLIYFFPRYTNCLSTNHKTVLHAKMKAVESLFNDCTQRKVRALPWQLWAVVTPLHTTLLLSHVQLLLGILDKRYIFSSALKHENVYQQGNKWGEKRLEEEKTCDLFERWSHACGNRGKSDRKASLFLFLVPPLVGTLETDGLPGILL